MQQEDTHPAAMCTIDRQCFKHASEGHETALDGGRSRLPTNVSHSIQVTLSPLERILQGCWSRNTMPQWIK